MKATEAKTLLMGMARREKMRLRTVFANKRLAATASTKAGVRNLRPHAAFD